jgi:hypothetical protein
MKMNIDSSEILNNKRLGDKVFTYPKAFALQNKPKFA